MRRILGLPLVFALVGCATTLTDGGKQVKVFGLDEAAPDASSAVPQACRLLQQTPPFDQEESERAAYDPYAKQRNAAAAGGGNVLLVVSKTIIRQPSSDCPPRSQTQECLSASQTWYRTSLRTYACPPEAVARLESDAASAERKGPLFTWNFGASNKTATAAAPSSPPSAAVAAAPPQLAPAPTPSPAPSVRAAAPPAPSEQRAETSATRLEKEILEMMKTGVGTDVIVAYVKGQRLAQKLTADDIITWKKAGIDDAVIRAALGD